MANMRLFRLPTAAALAAALMLIALAAFGARPAHAALFVVNSDGDQVDVVPGNGACTTADNTCTLRAAIQETNALAGTDFIDFNIPGSGPQTIRPETELPAITQPLIIDGYTQPMSRANTSVNGNNAELNVVLNGNDTPGSADGLTISAPGVVVRGLVINGWSLTGVAIKAGADGTRIDGNFIGTDPSGIFEVSNLFGVLATSSNNIIGGVSPESRNVISGNDFVGVGIFGAGNKVQNNFIGTRASGAGFMGNYFAGVVVTSSNNSSNNNTIGGAPSVGNRIAANNNTGVVISSGTGNRILSNSIHSNGELGIDLSAIGVTPNDPRDPDTGANNRQNFPVISSATTARRKTTIKGTLNSAPNRSFTVQFFSSPQADPSGFGEGQTLVGQRTVRTNARGNASFVFRPARAAPAGRKISATATDAAGNTSEFSRVRTVARGR